MADEPTLTPKGNEGTLNSEGTQIEKTIQTPPPVIPQDDGVDYKQRYVEARKGAEALLKEKEQLATEKADLEEKLAQASNNSLEKDLSVKYPDWDLMTESEKILAKNQERIDKQLAELASEKVWDKDFTKVKTKYPKLVEKENEFKEFCAKHPKGVDAETLAKSFLFDDRTSVKEEIKERKGLEKPTAGPNKISTPGMSLEDIKRLREEQPRVYEKMIREGRLTVPEK